MLTSRSLIICLSICTTLFPQHLALPATTSQDYGPYDYGIDRRTFSKRQSSKFYAITGVHSGAGPNGSVPLRREIREMEKDDTMWTLYILGLDMLQYTDRSDMLSWYQIGGIHGRPFVPFDGVQPKAGDEQNGYCKHVSILFPTWHRPYLALFEQVLHGLIERIAQQFPVGPVRDRYTDAAANFRIPYWDWAAPPPPGESVLPRSVGGSPSIRVNGPAGIQTIANPLWSYRFKPLDPKDLPDYPFDRYPETLRYPSSQSATAVSQNNLVAQQLDNNALSFRSRLYTLLTRYADYTAFSSEAWIDTSNNPNNYDSIESIHDQIHGLTGSGGHMTYIDYSAWDPLFWLHHAMIDRCFALWQVLNPDSYVVPEPERYNTFTDTAGDMQDIHSSLTPFHKTESGLFWDSDDVRQTETFGYSYSDTAKFNGADMGSQAITSINRLYGPGAASGSTEKFKPRANSSRKHTDWVANLRIKKYALKVPFHVHIFSGPFNASPSAWSFEPNLAGTHTIFVKARAVTNSNPDQLITATIPLTASLVKDVEVGNLRSLNEVDVTPFLGENLSYRISSLDDTAIGNEKVPSLVISVVSVDVQDPASENELPRWGEMRSHITLSTSGTAVSSS